MAEPLILNTIEQLGRALLATTAPATGVRATGTILVPALSGDVDEVDVLLPRNTYLLPVVGGQLREDLVYKTTADATIPARSPEPIEIEITSNVGGRRHNLPPAIFHFDPPIDGLPLIATSGAIGGGSDAGQLIESVGFYEDLEGANPGQDLFSAKVGDAGVLLVWTQSEPVEGSSGGLRQGATRATRAARFWRENFVLYVVASRFASDNKRRQNGHTILQAVTRLLTDRHQNDDGETLSTVGAGVEITSRARLGRSERHYIYALHLRVNQTLEQGLDARVFQRWERTRYVSKPEDLELVDATDPMP